MITNWLLDHRWATTVGLVAFLLLGPPVGAWLAGRPPLARRLAWLSLAPVAVLTLSPAWPYAADVRCAVQWSWPDLGAVEQVANVLLFAVPALLVTVAWRRAGATLLAGAVVSSGIEAVQALVPALGRACDTTDWVCNTLGAALGVALAWLALLLHRSVRSAAGAGPGDQPSSSTVVRQNG